MNYSQCDQCTPPKFRGTTLNQITAFSFESNKYIQKVVCRQLKHISKQLSDVISTVHDVILLTLVSKLGSFISRDIAVSPKIELKREETAYCRQ